MDKKQKNNLFDIITKKINSFYLIFVLIYIVLIVILTSALIIYSQKEIRQNSFNLLKNRYFLQANFYATEIKSTIKTKSLTIAYLRSILEKYQNLPEKKRRPYFNTLLKKTLISQPNLYSLFTVWKPYTIDKLDMVYKNSKSITGQYAKWYTNYNGNIDSLLISGRAIDILNYTISYFSKFGIKKFLIQAPVKEYNTFYGDTLVLIRIITPIIGQNGKILGIVGGDIPINAAFKSLPYELYSRLMLLNENLKFIYFPQKSYINRPLISVFPYITSSELFVDLIKNKKFFGIKKLFKNYDIITALPFQISNYQTWTIIILDQTARFAKHLRKVYKILFFVLLMLLLYVSFIIAGSLIITRRQLKMLNNVLKQISHGEYQVDVYKSRLFKYREFSDIKKHIITYNKRQISLNNFVKNLIKENYDIDPLKPLAKNDLLTQNLNELLRKLRENQKQQQEFFRHQQLESWRNTGLAKFNELLRKYINDVELLSYQLISQLTDYLNGVAGAFFIMHEDKDKHKYLEISGFYGYNRQIYKKKRFEIGEGLAGNVALEKKYTVTRVPKDYVEIASGLGKTPPNYIAIFPLVSNNIVYGVIEIAKIEPFQEHEIQFLEVLSGIIASSLASAQVAYETKALLEESKRITEQMQQKEKELQATIKKLEQLRENAEKQRIKLETIVNALQEIFYYAEFGPSKQLLTINKNLRAILKLSYAEATAKNYFELLQIPLSKLDEHKSYWEKIQKGRKVNFTLSFQVPDQNKTIWIHTILIPVMQDFKLDRVLLIGIDITELKEKELHLQKAYTEISEKEEQLKVHETELNIITQELEEAYKELESKNAQIKELQEKYSALKEEHDGLIKEFEKRIKRFRKIEVALHQKISALEEKLRQCGCD